MGPPYGNGMGIVWEAYHKGVPLLGVPENPIEYILIWEKIILSHTHLRICLEY